MKRPPHRLGDCGGVPYTNERNEHLMSWWKDGNYYKDEESCTEYSSRETRPPMTSFRSHEKKEWKETSRERGSKKEKEKKKQNNVTSPVQSLRINDEKKQKYNSKQ